MKKAIYVAISIVILYFTGALIYYKFWGNDGMPKNWNTNSVVSVDSFNECAAATGVVQESYPRRCIYNGLSFTEDIGNELEMTDTIQVDSPRPTATISSPLHITGKAVGGWFFEAQAPVQLLDDNQEVIAEGTIRTTGDWQTEEFVNFTADLTFTTPDTETGTLILKNDNPSGLDENSKELDIPVAFAQAE